MVAKLGYLTPSFKDAEEKEPTAYGENRGPLDRGEGYIHMTQYHGFIYSVQFLQHVRDHFPSSGSRKTSFSFPASKPQGSQHFKCPVCKQNSYNVGLFLHCNCCDSITCLTSVPTKVCIFKLIYFFFLMSHQELFSRQVHITQVFIIPPPPPHVYSHFSLCPHLLSNMTQFTWPWQMRCWGEDEGKGSWQMRENTPEIISCHMYTWHVSNGSPMAKDHNIQKWSVNMRRER